jgi:hypothetical protein
VISSISAEQLRLEMRSPSKNAFEKITTESPSVLARTGATVHLDLMRSMARSQQLLTVILDPSAQLSLDLSLIGE